MTAVLNSINISPVNMENRRAIDIRPGDTVKVWQKVEEKGKVRLQPFEGMVLARKHGSEAGATFTVRRVVGGIGVEKIFPLYSPMIDKIEIVRRVKTRRAKLYHIREKAARVIKRQMRKMNLVSIQSESDIEMATRAEEEKKQAEEALAEERDMTTAESQTPKEASPEKEEALSPEAQDSTEEGATEEKTEETSQEDKKESKGE